VTTFADPTVAWRGASDADLATTPGRLDRVADLLAQGDADTVIPVELQTRTWRYLHDESGAALTTRRSPGGHGLTGDDITALAAWVTERIA
jgi:phospholipase/carboxylesterase